MDTFLWVMFLEVKKSALRKTADVGRWMNPFNTITFIGEVFLINIVTKRRNRHMGNGKRSYSTDLLLPAIHLTIKIDTNILLTVFCEVVLYHISFIISSKK